MSDIVKDNQFDDIWNNLVYVTVLLDLLAAWGPNPGHPADFTGPGDVPDGNVNVTALLALLGAWGACP